MGKNSRLKKERKRLLLFSHEESRQQITDLNKMNILNPKYSKYFIFIIFLIGFIVFFPVLINGFVWDDLPYILNNPQVHQLNLPELLRSNLFNSGPFYRPIPAIYFAALYSLFGQQAFF